MWDTATAGATEKHMMQLPRGGRSISAIAVSDNKQYIFAADMSDDYKVHIFDTLNLDKKTNKPTPACPPAKAGDRTAIKAIDVCPGGTNFMSAGTGNHLW